MSPRRKFQKVSENGARISIGNSEPEDQTLSHSKTTSPSQDAASKNAGSLFVRSLGPEVTDDDLAEHFSQSYPIKHAMAVLDKSTKQCKGYGFVAFADMEDARKACQEFDGSEIKGRKISVEYAEARSRSDGNSSSQKSHKNQVEVEPPPKLIIRNLPWSINDPDKLRNLFRSFGKVNHVVIPKNPSGRMMGFGIVLIRGRKNAEKALNSLNGKEVDGRTIAVDWAVDKDTWEKEKSKAFESNGSKVDLAPQEDGDHHTGWEDEHESDHDQSADKVEEDDYDEDMPDVQLNDGEVASGSESEASNDKPVAKTDTNYTSVFIRNLPFTCTDEDLEDHFSQFGPVRFARVVYDHETGRPKGTGFVCFLKRTDADICVKEAPKYQVVAPTKDSKGKREPTGHSVLQDDASDPTGRFTIDGRVLNITRAVDKTEASRLRDEGVQRRNARDKDKRRLYLLSEGTIPRNSPLYQNLSPSEIAMRETSEKQRKALIENNPSLHLSLTRLAIRNIPRSVTSKELKALAREAVVEFAKDVKAGHRQGLSKEELARSNDEMREAERHRKLAGKGVVKQAKVVFESNAGSKVGEAEGAGRSRGYGFIEYYTHRSALMSLRWLNGHAIDYKTATTNGKRKNLDEQEKKKRLIAEFAIENAQVVKRRNELQNKMRGNTTWGGSEAKHMQSNATQEQKSNKIRSGKADHQAKPEKSHSGKSRPQRERDGPADGPPVSDVRQAPADKLAKRQLIIARKRMARRARKKTSS